MTSEPGSPLRATDAYPISIDVTYPGPGQLSRLMLFVKWLLIIPHLLVLMFLSFGMSFAIFLSWWAILFTGRYPRVLFDLVVGFQQWNLRVVAYFSLLVTDRYPPFSFGRPLTGGAIAVLVIGALALIGLLTLYTLLIVATVLGSLDPDAMKGGRGLATPSGGGFR